MGANAAERCSATVTFHDAGVNAARIVVVGVGPIQVLEALDQLAQGIAQIDEVRPDAPGDHRFVLEFASAQAPLLRAVEVNLFEPQSYAARIVLKHYAEFHLNAAIAAGALDGPSGPRLVVPAKAH